jgi:hypothetical protein
MTLMEDMRINLAGKVTYKVQGIDDYCLTLALKVKPRENSEKDCPLQITYVPSK